MTLHDEYRMLNLMEEREFHQSTDITKIWADNSLEIVTREYNCLS